MDFQFAFWQMIYLFFSPQKVFRDFVYRKRNYFRESILNFNLNKYVFSIQETKNQFARDDPAFVVLLSAFLISNFNIFKTVKKLHQMISFTLIHNFTWSQKTKHTKYRRRFFLC
jgi:hypothetical protein